MNQKEVFGKWGPTRRPAIFFKKVSAPKRFATFNFSPQYRLPIYEAVFHDSVVVTDRWEFSLLKIKSMFGVRSILQLLYGVAPVWNLDRKEIKVYGSVLKAHQAFFEPLHRKRFEWLTSDRLVQRSRFGEGVTITANFRSEPWETIPGGCVRAESGEGTEPRFYCPPSL
jgi:Glycosyl hydrolases related to GH101 family, GH129